MTEQRPVKPYSVMTLRELAQELSAIRAEYDAGQPFDQVSVNTLNNVEAELVRRHDLALAEGSADSQPEAATASSTTSAETPPKEKDEQGPYGTQHNLPDPSFFLANRGPGNGYLNAEDDFGDSAKEY